MLDIDHLYDKVAKGNPTRDDLLEIIDQVDNANSFGNSSFTVDDLFLKISQSDKATDDMIKFMYDVQVAEYRGDDILTPKMLDNGSKELFDSIWNNGMNKHGRWIKLWRSVHADEKQLGMFYKETLAKKDKNTDKRWFDNLKKSFFSHPNCPPAIQNRNLKNKDLLIEMAKIPRPSEKTLEAIKKALWAPGVLPNDPIYDNFTTHSALTWKEIANYSELKAHLENAFGSFTTMSKARKEMMLKFCKRDDTPEQVRVFLYDQTKDEDFLPQTAKDIFLF